MGIFETVTYAVMKRPFILVLIGILMLLAAVANAFVPVIAMIMGIINMTGGGIFEAVLSVLQMMIDPGIIPVAFLSLAVVTLLASAAVGLLLPGYLLIVDDGLAHGDKKKGLFLAGLKSGFLRFFLITVRTVPITFLLVIFLMVASVPAIVVTKAALTTRPNLLIAAVFVDIVTIGMLFMCLSFFKAYVYLWYIAAARNSPKPFKTGKALADRNFWKLASGLFAFDAVFAGALFAIYLSDSQWFRYAAGWVFTTGFFTTLAVYLVRTYRDCTRKDSGSDREAAPDEDQG